MGYYNRIPQNSSFKNIYLLDLEGIRNSDNSQEKGMLLYATAADLSLFKQRHDST